MDTLWPSVSLAFPLHDKVVVGKTPVFGEIATPVKVGARLLIVTLELAVSIPPLESVTVALQTIVSAGLAIEELSVRVGLLPSTLDPFVQE